MDEKCHKTQDIDLALFLIEPHGSEWQEFRAHYPQCLVCSAELQKWTSLEHHLRSLGNPEATGHPSPETLVQFQQHLALLSTENRDSIALHLSACITCREEVKLLGAFDSSRISQWGTDTKAVVSSDEHESWSTRFWNALRPVFLHPAFAAGLVLLLSVPFIRSYYLSSLNQVPLSSDIVHTSAPPSTVGGAQAPQEPAAGLKEQPPAESEVQVAVSAPPLQRGEFAQEVPAPSVMESKPEAAKAKEETRPTALAKRPAQHEGFAAKDERAPAPPPPASSAPSNAVGLGRRDEAVMPQEKSRAMMEEKKQQPISEPQKSALIEEREARSTEGPVTIQRPQEEDASPLAGGSSAPVTAAARMQGNIVPQESGIRSALSVLMATYKNAYEARDINTLGTVWHMTPAWQETLAELFAKSQQITLTLTLDENNLTESADQRQAFAPITQLVTSIAADGQTSTHGPFYCLADLRKQERRVGTAHQAGQWKIHDLLEDPQHPGQCHAP